MASLEGPEKLTPFGNAIAGAAGAVFANTLVFPLDVIKTRLQVQNKVLNKAINPSQQYSSAVDAFLKILKSEGITGLYAGIASGLSGTVMSAFAYFYFYSSLRTRYIAARIKPGQEISTAMELLLGAGAGALSQLFTLPVAVVTTRQQTASREEKKSFFNTLAEIFNAEGIPGLWKGLKASLVLCSNPAITYGMFERIKTLILKRKEKLGISDPKLSNLEVFITGALSKTLATVVTYPYIMAKVRMQWRPPKAASDQLTEHQRKSLEYKSSLDVLRKVFDTEGVKGWYNGMHAQIVKAVLCQAILFVGKEEFSAWTLALFVWMAKRRNTAALLK